MINLIMNLMQIGGPAQDVINDHDCAVFIYGIVGTVTIASVLLGIVWRWGGKGWNRYERLLRRTSKLGDL